MPQVETVKTSVTQLLNIKYPIILAGMNTSAGPRLAAAVSNNGGLGVMGGVSYTPAQLREQIVELKSLLHDKTAFGVDLLLPQVGGSARKTNKDYTHGQLPEMIDIIIEEKARMFVSAVGVPPKWAVDKLHEAGIICMNMVGMPSHVDKAMDVGMDIMCATGYEAGGHVGEVGTLVLVPQIVDACKGKVSPLTGGPVPVVAAGGIHDGRTLAAVISLGAEAAWVGTRFLASVESTPVKKAAHMRNIINAKPTDTVRTLIYSGRPLRVFKTEYVQSWEGDAMKRAEIDQLTSNGKIPFQSDRQEKEKNGQSAGQIGFDKGFSVAKFHRNLMGQASAAITSIRPAKEIIQTMMADCLSVLKSHSSLVQMVEDQQLPDIDEPAVKIAPTPAKEFTAAEIAQHNGKAGSGDCWVVVNGKVLDLSKFQHPGGSEPITMYAGKDASEEFNMMHAETMIYKNVPQAIIGSLKADSKL